MNIELLRALVILGYSIIALATYFICCLWDRHSTEKIRFSGCLFCGTFWPVAIVLGISWWLLSLLEIVYEKIATPK